MVPNNHVGRIYVQTDFRNTDLYVEGGIRESRHAFPRCVIWTDGKGEALIPVLNISGEALRISSGSKVTRGEKCEEKLPKNQELNDVPVTSEEMDTDLEGEQAERVLELLNEYKDLVSRKMSQIGCTNLLEIDIELDDNKPVFYRPHRLAYGEREQMKDWIKDLKNADIIEDSNSPFASPMLLVRKPTGEVRMCIDFSALNKKTVKHHYPIPRIDDLLDQMAGKKLFTTLDLASGCYQVPVARDSWPKTAFVTPDGHYQFQRMPFGLYNTPAVFQRLMNCVLGSLPDRIAMTYIDDTIVPAKNFEEGLKNLRQVFDALRAAQLTLRLEKCHFFKQSVEYCDVVEFLRLTTPPAWPCLL